MPHSVSVHHSAQRLSKGKLWVGVRDEDKQFRTHSFSPEELKVVPLSFQETELFVHLQGNMPSLGYK